MQRDWGSAADYVSWMFLLLSVGQPGEYIFGTGKNSSVEDFLMYCAQSLELDLLKVIGESESIVSYVDANSGVVYANADANRFSANRFSYGASNPSKLFKSIGAPPILPLSQIASAMIKVEQSRLTNNS
jgi:GDP-D-mannose dehydratase